MKDIRLKRGCPSCGGTGVIETGNNDLPCDCPAGAKAKFNVAGVKGKVTGAEVAAHFLNTSPLPIHSSVEIKASELPGRRRKRAIAPCPSCGGKSIYAGAVGGLKYGVQCRSCGMGVTSCVSYDDPSRKMSLRQRDALDEAVRTWNRRDGIPYSEE